jgi:hypothetical protein
VRGCYLPVLEPGATTVEVPIYRSHVRAATPERSFGNKDFLENHSRERVPKPPPALLGAIAIEFQAPRYPRTNNQKPARSTRALTPATEILLRVFPLNPAEACARGRSRPVEEARPSTVKSNSSPTRQDSGRTEMLGPQQFENRIQLAGREPESHTSGHLGTPCAFRQSAALGPQYLRRTPARANAMHCRVPVLFPLDPAILPTEESSQS